MLKSEVKAEKLTKQNILQRASLRGLKKCTSCGFINGQRALICRNINCDLRKKRLSAIRPFDPIQLVTYCQRALYSLRSKEKLQQPRNFVSIAHNRGSEESKSSAICYVDNCKYDAFETTHLVCRHIKACKVLTNVSVAEVYPIDKSILWNLNIATEQKQYLWDLYKLEETFIPPVQKLNTSMFAVKCIESKAFPAGRLHCIVYNNRIPNKSGTFSCFCKKLKIILEPDNSVVMKQEVCDHLLLLLSAILSKHDGKILYGKFLDALQYLWMPTCLNTPIIDCGSRHCSQFANNDYSLEKCSKTNITVENTEVSDNSMDIFKYTEELLAENDILDFSDIILDTNNDKVSNILNLTKPNQTAKTEMYIRDPKLNATITNINDEEMDLHFSHYKSPESLTSLHGSYAKSPIDFNRNGLSLIEPFQLNQDMQVPSDNMELAKDIECLNNLESQVIEANSVLPSCIIKQKSLLRTTTNSNNTEAAPAKPIKITTTFPVQKSMIFNQGHIKLRHIATPVKQYPAERNIKTVQITTLNPNIRIMLNSDQYDSSAKQIENDSHVVQTVVPGPNHTEDKQIQSTLIPSMSYESWLDHIIEILNENITVRESSIKTTFYVPDSIFNHFSKSFTLNNKRRHPHKTTIIKNGKYAGHMKYAWHFNHASTVKRIFTSKTIQIELERLYQQSADNTYELYTPATVNLTGDKYYRRIYPKVQLYKAFVQFSNNKELCSNDLQPHNCDLKLEWLPSVFPKSNFGLMTIEFYVSSKEFNGTM